jgi:hypothetical protein
MAHRNANRPGGTGGEARRGAQPHVVKQTPAEGEPAPSSGAARGRRPLCGQGASVGARVEDVLQTRRPGSRKAVLDMGGLDVLIVQQWTKTLRGPYDWGDWPLARYTLGAEVLRFAEGSAGNLVRCEGPVVEQLAWACAMVACGRAPRLRSLDPRPLTGGELEQQLIRADGARGWRCNILRDTTAGPQLHYWINPLGHVEFETIAEQVESCPA